MVEKMFAQLRKQSHEVRDPQRIKIVVHPCLFMQYMMVKTSTNLTLRSVVKLSTVDAYSLSPEDVINTAATKGHQQHSVVHLLCICV